MIVRDAQWYSALPYAIEVVPDVTTEGEPCYVARHPELPGCLAHGGSATEALEALREAKLLYIESLLEDGEMPSIPEAAKSGRQGTVAVFSVVPSFLIPGGAHQQIVPSVAPARGAFTPVTA